MNDRNLCPKCNSKCEHIFSNYLECTGCKHIFLAQEINIPIGCPNCKYNEFIPLFDNVVECKKCKHMFELVKK